MGTEKTKIEYGGFALTGIEEADVQIYKRGIEVGVVLNVIVQNERRDGGPLSVIGFESVMKSNLLQFQLIADRYNYEMEVGNQIVSGAEELDLTNYCSVIFHKKQIVPAKRRPVLTIVK